MEWIKQDFNETKSTECNICPETKSELKIQISKSVITKIKTLCAKFPDLEWMGGVYGNVVEDYFLVTGIIVYDQEVSGSTVELTDQGTIDMNYDKNIKGWIHSHNKMEVFFSETDIGTANWNKLSLIVNNKMEIIGKTLAKLTCGREMLVNCKIEIENEIDEGFYEKIKGLITDKITKIKNLYPANVSYQEICAGCKRIVSGKKKAYSYYGEVYHKKCLKKAQLPGFDTENNLVYDYGEDDFLQKNIPNKYDREEKERTKEYDFGTNWKYP